MAHAAEIKQITMIIIFYVSVSFGQKNAQFLISSPAVTDKQEVGFFSGIKSDGRIADMYAAKENDPPNTRSFPITWKNLPENTKVLALIFDDPDAKPVMKQFGIKGETFIHWIAANIPVIPDSLKSGISPDDTSLVQGKNTAGTIGYFGPQPPSKIPANARQPIVHIYRLKVYALSDTVNLIKGFSAEELKEAIKDKISGEAVLNMSYSN